MVGPELNAPRIIVVQNTNRQRKSRLRDDPWGKMAISLLNMAHTLLEQRNDMLIFHPIVSFFAIPARLYNPHAAGSAESLE
jgi:hypothetical protein